jgi:hypothetical protein
MKKNDAYILRHDIADRTLIQCHTIEEKIVGNGFGYQLFVSM